MTRIIAVVLSLMIFVFPIFGYQSFFTVPPTNKNAKYKGIRIRERLVITGEIKIVPMFGATVVIQSPTLGQVELGKLLDFPVEIQRQLEELESQGSSIEAKGLVLTLCTDKQIKKGVLGCRAFDAAKAVVIRQM